MEATFEKYNTTLETIYNGEESIREAVRSLQNHTRQIKFLCNKTFTLLSQVEPVSGRNAMYNDTYETDKAAVIEYLDSSASPFNIRPDIIAFAQDCIIYLRVLSPIFTSLKDTVLSIGNVDQFRDMWRFTLGELASSVIFFGYIATGKLLTIEDVVGILSLPVELTPSLEDYLHMVVSLPSECVRLALNCVCGKLYTLPKIICQFSTDISNGFRLLNMKNDSLRKKFDAIKYSINKLEEITYEVTLRDLTNKQ